MPREFEDDLFDDLVPDEGGQFSVTPDADLESTEGDIADDEGQTDASGDGQGLTRQEKKRRRYDELQAERDRLAAENERQKAMLQQAQASWQQFAPPQQGQQQVDPEVQRLEAALADNDKRRQELEAVWRAEHAEGSLENNLERQKQLRQDYMRLDDERLDLRTEIRAAKHRPTPQQVSQYHQSILVQTRWPDIAGNEALFNYASAIVQKERFAEPNKRFTTEDFDRIAEQTRTDFGLKAPPVSDATRDRYSGHGTGGNGSQGSASGLSQKLTREDVTMALAAYPEIAESKGKKAALARYWREVKAPMLKEAAQQGRHSG